ncbi:hypothetical protein GCM10010123_41310 [Pilimelia anulata]|uniref:Penicillin-binding protein transpeptidase domain-containing protein n=1 Tax=Pilimelia anulata TaxID=53371 RepID=A0A8J3BGB5_9ACTN|nr:FtsW/RodA/SpoVE family cell cycle protein [Pilimelia anulata]GGK07203.1 hypothetical protein GCM10010123_41310 [Pilimelia anulata]
MAAGFWLSRSVDTLWLVFVAGSVGALVAGARGLLRRRGAPAGPALGAVLAAAVLFEVGALLTVRLAVVPDPGTPFAGGLSGDALATGRGALAFPLLGVAAVLGLARLPGRGAAAARLRAAGRRLAGLVDTRWRAAALVGLAAVVALPFLLPLGGESVGSARLTVLGVATPEYGKLLFIAALAVVVGYHSHRYAAIGVRVRGGERWRVWVARQWRANRFALYPLLLFFLVAVASGLRQDFGTLVSACAATVGVIAGAIRANAARMAALHTGPLRFGLQWRDRLGGYWSFLRGGRILLIPAVTGLLVALGLIDYIGERITVWRDPWAFRWDSGCAPAPAAGAAADGTVACLRSLAADAESERSQVARALAAIADGGLWGRGLRDTASGAVPAGSTDFVLAVAWNKLGGLVVLAVTVLVLLLGAALLRAARPADHATRGAPSGAELFAAGVAAMVVGQYLFVLAATLNLLPHSGVPAPLLSRGGQGTLAILLAVAAVVALAPPGAPAPPPPGRFAAWSGVAVGAAAAALLVAVATVLPYRAPLPAGGLPAAYDEHRPACPARAADRDGLTSPQPAARGCSTDLIALNRTAVEVRFGGRAGLRQVRPDGEWALAGPPPGGLELADLAGLVRVGPAHIGVLERSYPRVVAGTAGSDLARRLAPPAATGPDGWLDLTIDPALQHAIAAELRRPAPGATGPLAGGVVAVDARTGHVLASASAPGDPAAPPAAAGAAGGATNERPYYGRLGPDGTPDGTRPDERCRRRDGDRARQVDCWRWDAVTPPAGTDAATAELRRWVDGDPAVALPEPGVNRALGKWYGLGSVFKVVIAAEYLSEPGTAEDDALPAPTAITLAPGRTITNAGGGPCTGAAGGRITLARALATSCNTAFVALARRLGWARVAARAGAFGLHVGACADVPPWANGPLVGGVASCVPADSDGVSIGNDALGGGAVQGTPLAVATVLAAVANGGRAVQPTLVTAAATPDRGRPAAAAPPRTNAALPAPAAARLRAALAGTAVDGTARGLAARVGAPLWVKTGTHEVVPAGQPLPAGEFVRQHAWLAGFVDTARGPVAFAAVAETRDEAAGAARVRRLAEVIGTTLGRAR